MPPRPSVKHLELDAQNAEDVLIETARDAGYLAFRQPNVLGTAAYALVYPKGARPKDCNPQNAAAAFRINESTSTFQWCANQGPDQGGYRLDPAHEITLPDPDLHARFHQLLETVG